MPQLDEAVHNPYSLDGPIATALPLHKTCCTFGDWEITATKAPMLSSQCTCTSNFTENGGSFQNVLAGHCSFCRNNEKIKLEHTPDMIFADNLLRIEHRTRKFGIEFNSIDAVNSIKPHVQNNVQVATAAVWQESRTEALEQYSSNRVDYDWTYTPEYKGTIFGEGISVEPTEEQLDMSMLSRRDPVRFFEEVQLYGDELDDNGCAEMEAKIRVVDEYLFVLLRFYLRVDKVLVRLLDTRLVLQKGKRYMLRECSSREAQMSHLPRGVSPMDPMAVWASIPPQQLRIEKLTFSS